VSQNVQAVNDLFTAFAARDHDAAARCMHADVEIRPALVGGPEGVVYRGLDGSKQWWADIDAAWAEFRIEADEFHDLGDHVLVLGRAIARGRESGVALETRTGWVARMRDGRIGEFRSFATRRDALEAVGWRDT
jgi:ketosteroid isomerase-like protein